MDLSTISLDFKKAVVWLGLLLAGLAILWILWLGIQVLFKIIFPPPPPGPNTAFGTISKPFSYNFAATNVSIELDTPGEKLPSTPQMMKIYAIPNVEGKFTSLENAKKIARSNGLDSEPTRLSENEWRWTQLKNSSRDLKFNIVTGNFIYTYDWVVDPSALQGIFKTTDEEMIRQARRFISSYKSLKDDLKKSPTRISFYKLVGREKNKASSYSEANAVLVEFFRDKIEGKYEIVEADPTLSPINILISPSTKSEKQILELNFTYWAYDNNKTGTYPIRTATQAFEELKAGNAYVATGQNIIFDNLSIVEVSLAYFNPVTEIRYFQPVYVFKGEEVIKGQKQTFVAYVPAIKADYLK